MSPETMAYLLKYDSTQGKFKGEVKSEADAIIVNGTRIPVLNEKDPARLPWGKLGAEMVLESTGIFTSEDGLVKHLQAGAKKVLLSVPPKKSDGAIKIIVYGVNHETLKPTDTMVSNASCTTNCLAPMAKVIHEEFGIEKGFMTTVHSYTNDQRVLDQQHKDLRRARAAAVNMIPTTTGAARAVGVVIPELKGKIDGISIRVPTPDGSVTDLVAVLKRDATPAQVNAALKAASEGRMKGIMEYTEDPIVSTDIIGNPASSIIDGMMTSSIGGNMIKVLSWYDNEWGYSNRCIDLFKLMAR
jgi:glyceraldehyde 3-phosphate dehydrogenase